MKKIITMALFAVATLTSCELDKEDVAIAPDPSDPVENFDDIYALGWAKRDGQTARATINFDVTEEAVTRSSGSAMERKIADVNLYFYNEVMGISQHIFLGDNTSVTLPITPGDWSIYAIANSGSDMRAMGQEEIKGYRYEIVNEGDIKHNDALIMSYFGEANIGGMLDMNICFTRVVARIDIRVELLDEALSKVTLNRLRLVNIPKKTELFGDGSAPESDDLMTYDYRDCGNGSTFSIYMLENLSGENDTILTEEQKTAENAPSTAAYIDIEGTTVDSWVTYRIYLGEDNTSDFNVCRNNAYDMEISIYSTDASDFRTTVRPFPLDVNISVTQGSCYSIFYKFASAMYADKIVSTVKFTVNLDKAVKYNIDVKFQLHADRGEVMGGISAVGGTNDKPLIINIPAGATYGSIVVENTQADFLSYPPRFIYLSEVVKLSNTDENNYYPAPTYECAYDYRWQNY